MLLRQRLHTQGVLAVQANCARRWVSVPTSRGSWQQRFLWAYLSGIIHNDSLERRFSLLQASLFQHQLFGKSVRLCSIFLTGQPCERDSEDLAGEPKRNLVPLGVLQGQLHCHIESLCLPVWYLPDKLHAPLSLQQGYRIEVCRLHSSGPFLQEHPHCQDTPSPRCTKWVVSLKPS